MLQMSNIVQPKQNPTLAPASRSNCRRIRELRCQWQIQPVAHILRDFSLAPVPWMIVFRTTQRSSLRHEAVLFQTSEPGALVARWHRVRDARRVSNANRSPVARLTRTPHTAKAYTCRTTRLRPER